MKIAHVRERRAPAGAPWRLAAALDADGTRWMDLEASRRSLVARDPARAHNSALFRQPITTLDAHLAGGLRVDALADLLEADAEEPMDASVLLFGPPILAPPTFRDFYAFEQHVGTMWKRRDMEIPEAWYRLPIFYFSNTSEIRGPDEPVWAPRGSSELDYELEVAALIDTPVQDLDAARGEEAIGGYLILNDWSARDLQREETTVRLGPAKGKDFASSIGPWLVTPDELTDARSGKGYDLAMTASVNGAELSRGIMVVGPLLLRRDGRACLGRRSPAARRPPRLGHGRNRLPARDPRRDARALPRARRHGQPGDRTAR